MWFITINVLRFLSVRLHRTVCPPESSHTRICGPSLGFGCVIYISSSNCQLPFVFLFPLDWEGDWDSFASVGLGPYEIYTYSCMILYVLECLVSFVTCVTMCNNRLLYFKFKILTFAIQNLFKLVRDKKRKTWELGFKRGSNLANAKFDCRYIAFINYRSRRFRPFKSFPRRFVKRRLKHAVSNSTLAIQRCSQLEQNTDYRCRARQTKQAKPRSEEDKVGNKLGFCLPCGALGISTSLWRVTQNPESSSLPPAVSTLRTSSSKGSSSSPEPSSSSSACACFEKTQAQSAAAIHPNLNCDLIVARLCRSRWRITPNLSIGARQL